MFFSSSVVLLCSPIHIFSLKYICIYIYMCVLFSALCINTENTGIMTEQLWNNVVNQDICNGPEYVLYC